MRNSPTCMPLLLILSLFLPALAAADDGKELFDKQCASCHTIGGGDTGGPDLKGVTAKRTHEWLETVIMEPDKLTAAKDPVQIELVKKYGYEMPNLGIGHDDALKIITYLPFQRCIVTTPMEVYNNFNSDLEKMPHFSY